MGKHRNYTKTQRMQAMLGIFERFGRLRFEELVFQMARKLDADRSNRAFQRAIYRDLEELEWNNNLKVDVFTRDGVLIEEYDSDSYRNVYKEWYIAASEGKIIGSRDLEKVHGEIFVPKIMRNDFSMQLSSGSPDSKKRYMYFQVGSHFFCLKSDFDAFVYTLILSRINGNINQQEIKEIETTFGKRAMLLKLPHSQISSYEQLKKKGHALIRAIKDSEIELDDLGSTNGLKYYPLTKKEAEEMRIRGVESNDKTITSSWSSLPHSKLSSAIVVNSLTRVSLPILIEIGDSNPFHLLIT